MVKEGSSDERVAGDETTAEKTSAVDEKTTALCSAVKRRRGWADDSRWVSDDSGADVTTSDVMR